MSKNTRICKSCKGEFLLEWAEDTHKVCPDCRPGQHNTTYEERDIYMQTKTNYGRRLTEGFKMMREDDYGD